MERLEAALGISTVLRWLAALAVAVLQVVVTAGTRADPLYGEDLAAVARVHVQSLVDYSDRDVEALLASADARFLAWLEAERRAALSLPADRLLSLAPSVSRFCVSPGTALRVLALRQVYPPARIAALSQAELLGILLTLHPAPVLEEDRRTAALSDPVRHLRNSTWERRGDRAYLLANSDAAGLYHMVSVAIRQADGSWRPDHLWLLGFYADRAVILSDGFVEGLDPAGPAAWTAEAYLEALGASLPGAPLSLARLRGLAKPGLLQGEYNCLPNPMLPPQVLCWSETGEIPCGY